MLNIFKITLSIIVLIIAIVIANLHNIKNKTKIKYFKIFDKLNKYDIINDLHSKLIIKINLFTSSYEMASNYAYLCICIYFFIVIISTLVISFLNYVWYIKVINVLLILVLPYFIINSFINFKYAGVKKQIPVAIEEFQYYFFRTKKIDSALKETSQHLKGNIKKPFQMCYYNISKGEEFAIQILKDTFKDKYMDTFCQLLLVYIKNGGDEQTFNATLTSLITQINLDISFKKKQQDRFVKYKIGAIMLIIFTVIINKYLGKLFDNGLQSDNVMTIILILFFTIYFFFIDLLEKF